MSQPLVWVLLPDKSGREQWVEKNCVCAIQPDGGNWSKVMLDNGKTIKLTGTVAETREAIDNATP